ETRDAKCVVVDTKTDVALLELPAASLTNIEFSVVPPGPAELPRSGDVVLACGNPAREVDGGVPVVRLGEIHGVTPATVRSSCTLSSGDSGGPLVNSLGSLVGLHRQIGARPSSNEHLPLTVIHQALEMSDRWKSLKVQTQSSATVVTSQQLLPTARIRHATHQLTAELHGISRYGKPDVHVLATVLNNLYVVTKLSEIAACRTLSCRFEDGTTTSVEVEKADRTLDLALLKLKNPRDDDAAITELHATARQLSLTCGEIVYTAAALEKISGAGLITRTHHDEPTQSAKFGAVLAIVGNGVQVTELSPNGSAQLAGLQSGDMLRTIDATDVTSLQVVDRILGIRQPGDWISLVADRNQQRVTAEVQLQHAPGQLFEMTEFLDGRAGNMSHRRSGFTAVLQHDIVIEPDACGGPLLSGNGRIIGVNIARRGRESTLAIPIADVIGFSR
ncbi:MAG: trypsin-like peptidase domain-containing protein, partial [Planctomycetaceae bacterium]|nr:trypsin-like peptidase domain-containing protein [Planctomycetaceae bacterium]